METNEKKDSDQTPDRSYDPQGHGWKGSWSRPMRVDEKSLDSFTVARMTDHNVRGPDGNGPESIETRIGRQTMKRNVGNRERYGRIGVGVLSGIGAIFLPAGAVVRIGLGIIGLAGLGTGISRYCPVNQALGIDNYGPAKPEEMPKEEKAHEKMPEKRAKAA